MTVDVSLVSHGHGPMVLNALQALAASYQRHDEVLMRVWLTLNVPEPEFEESLSHHVWPFELQLIHNSEPLGFGANHNQAFAHVQLAGGGQWFVVMNPDIFWPKQVVYFWASLNSEHWPKDLGLLCPQQVDAKGAPQDFVRQLITPWGVLARVVRRVLRLQPSGLARSVASADWVNGACMVWRSQAFADLGGFDERYFMYCEDTDICLRMRLAGLHLREADVAVIHDARRNTGRSWQHLRWHLRSLWRLWSSAVFWRYVRSGKSKRAAS